MATDPVPLQDWLQLIRAAYEEFPDLRPTQHQVEELREPDTMVACTLLSTLVSTAVLEEMREGDYVRAAA